MTLQTVITSKQAKQITGGRTPLVPVQYEAAIKALAECIVLDDAKTWSDKADALAAWAKIYRDDKVSRQAAILKLHAYRRMKEIAEELRPTRPQQKGIKNMPGAKSLLLEMGVKRTQANHVMAVGNLPQHKFDEAISSPRVPTPNVVLMSRLRGSNGYVQLRNKGDTFRSFCRAFPAASFAREFSADEAGKARELVRELSDWLDEFEQNLPKAKP